MKRRKFPEGVEGEKDQIRSEGIRELFIIRPGELPMKTETPPGKVDPFVMMEVVEHAFSLPEPNGKGKKKRILLSERYRNTHDVRMISKSRKGRLEIEKMVASQGVQDFEEFGI